MATAASPRIEVNQPHLWAMVAVVLSAAALAAWVPVQLSIAAVFLFAGPHNWMEARYFASRMPVRWTGQIPFFALATAGIALLSLSFSLVPVSRPVWHSILAIWVLCLIRLARRSVLDVALPVAFLWMALAWIAAPLADLTLVFLHPVAALWFTHRQIARSRPEWLQGFRTIAFAIVPLAAMVFVFHRNDVVGLSMNLSFAQVSRSTSLVALHAFLELLHYGAWVILLPAIGLASAPWSLNLIPLVRHRKGWPKLTKAIFVAGAAAVVILWISFGIDYSTTRNLYFTLAIVHVLAEVPFLAWLR